MIQGQTETDDAVAARLILAEVERLVRALGVAGAVPPVAVACVDFLDLGTAVVHGQMQVNDAVAPRGVLQDHHGLIRAFDVGDSVPRVAVADLHFKEGSVRRADGEVKGVHASAGIEKRVPRVKVGP